MSDAANEPDPDAPLEPVAVPEQATRRTWPQRFTIAGLVVGAVVCFVAATALYAGQRVVEDRNLVAIDDPSESDSTGLVIDEDGLSTGGSTPDQAPTETFPLTEPDARNFLITGADNNSCIDPDSPYAAAFGDRSNFGERSDTIMMWRVNPATSQVAVLSFPRDLWVTIAGESGKSKINEAYSRDQPQQLIDTIYENFGVVTDHFIQIDFCAFKRLVDAVDGVTIPFDRPIRDVKTGMYVPSPGCFTFTGDHALAYVRSRALEYYTDDGDWESDNAFDLGRISRQQDFIRRVVDELLSAGAFDPDVVRGLVDTSSDYVVTDDGLTPRKILEFAGVMSGVDPADIRTYQIESRSDNIQGQSVQVPRIEGDNMQAVLSIFRGQATLDDAPEQVLTTDSSAPPTSITPSTPPPASTEPPFGATTTTVDPTATTLPAIAAEDIIYGYVPDADASC
jgi:LCP family protein required for cell wall assembly